MPAIQHITELFIYDDSEFITMVYRSILQREPDPAGMNYYLGRLNMGYGKATIIVKIASSLEAASGKQITGLANLIKEETRANHWFWGFFTRQLRNERLMYQHINVLTQLNQHIVNLAIQTPTPSDNIQENTPSLPVISLPSDPDELNKLPSRARNIYYQLKKVISQQNDGVA